MNSSLMVSNQTLLYKKIRNFYSYIFFLLYITHLILSISAILASNADDTAINKPGGMLAYSTLPCITLVIPNPITPAMITFRKCEIFENCEKTYPLYYLSLFFLDLFMYLISFLVCVFKGIDEENRGFDKLERHDAMLKERVDSLL